MAVINPTGDNQLLGEAVAMRKISRLERFLGPDNYRVLQGLLKTPASITGSVLILLFVVIAVAAPVLAPPVNAHDPYEIPRDGFPLPAVFFRRHALRAAHCRIDHAHQRRRIERDHLIEDAFHELHAGPLLFRCASQIFVRPQARRY